MGKWIFKNTRLKGSNQPQRCFKNKALWLARVGVSKILKETRFLHLSKNGRLPVDPMKDVPAKIALEYDLNFTKFLIQTFLHLDVATVEELHLDDKELPLLQEILEDNSFEEMKLSMDTLVTLKDGRQVIVEIQMQHQAFFVSRLWVYTFLTAGKQFLSMAKHLKVKERYPKIKPIYSLAIVKGKYFDDDRPYRTFSLRDIETGEDLIVLNVQSGLPQDLLRMTIVEVDKYNPELLTAEECFLYEFYLNKNYSSGNIPQILSLTDKLLGDKEHWKKEDRMRWENEEYIRDEVRAEAEQEADAKLSAIILRMIQRGFQDSDISDLLDIPLQRVAQTRSE